MTHEQAYELCHGNTNFGHHWNTSYRSDCDLAWAIAEQYEENEIVQAKAAIATVEAGYIPAEWAPADGNTLQPLPDGHLVCMYCRDLVIAEPDTHGCGCHCPSCGCTL